MQLLSVAIALGALGFTFALARSRKGVDRYGIVLVVLPLALATPLVALMASGLQLIDAFRKAGAGEGLGALATGARRAVETQYVGHITFLALLGALALVLMALAVSRTKPQEDDNKPSPDTKPLSKFAVPLMTAAALVCIAAVTVLAEYEGRFVASPLAITIAFDADDISEFSDNKRDVDEQRRRGSNTLVAETFRSLVVAVLFLVLFDAFLVGSRSVVFKRSILLSSAALIALASVLAVRAFYQNQELRLTVEAHRSQVEDKRELVLDPPAEKENQPESEAAHHQGD